MRTISQIIVVIAMLLLGDTALAQVKSDSEYWIIMPCADKSWCSRLADNLFDDDLDITLRVSANRRVLYVELLSMPDDFRKYVNRFSITIDSTGRTRVSSVEKFHAYGKDGDWSYFRCRAKCPDLLPGAKPQLAWMTDPEFRKFLIVLAPKVMPPPIEWHLGNCAEIDMSDKCSRYAFVDSSQPIAVHLFLSKDGRVVNGELRRGISDIYEKRERFSITLVDGKPQFLPEGKFEAIGKRNSTGSIMLLAGGASTMVWAVTWKEQTCVTDCPDFLTKAKPMMAQLKDLNFRKFLVVFEK